LPSIRVPITLRRALKANLGSVTLSSPGVDGTQPQPPLTEADPRLQAFLRVNFDVFYDWNIQTGAVYFAEQLDGLLGLPPGGFPRSLEGWLAYVHPDDHDAVCADLWTSVTAGLSFRGEYRLRRSDGTYTTVSDQGVVLLDAEGTPTNMIGAMRDVTGERAAERARAEAEELRRVLFRIGKPAMQIDMAGDYVDATPAALEFFRRTPEDMLAANVRDDFPARVLGIVGGETPVDQGGTELEVDCTVAGEVKSLVLTVLPCHLGDDPGFFLLGTDITAQKMLQRELARSERALRRQATITDERNAALRVLLEQREQDRTELEERVVGNVEQLIEPTLDRLSKALRHRPERMELEALRVNLREIVGPFAQRLRDVKGGAAALTRRETEVANLVRLGKTSDEIAEALHVSSSSVAFHRANIRRKLGIPKRGPHLATHLTSLGGDRPL
jgi:DNA-binding CsgD family transcriptional regulator/PAS domain-containing protein